MGLLHKSNPNNLCNLLLKPAPLKFNVDNLIMGQIQDLAVQIRGLQTVRCYTVH